jgi:tRNA pseudouridine55 synthase
VKVARLSIDGVLLLNKPVGLTSNTALQRAKRLFNAAKAGHTGTLDPFASGLLPICFGQATKFSGHALHGDKTYRAVLKLGVTTTTGDIEGQIMDTRPVDVAIESVREILPRFTGTIQQVPPMYSALKHQGKPLYEYARAGMEIERKSREVTIAQLEIESLNHDQLAIKVQCSGGTYIRTLAEDIGEALGCGAHLIALERTASKAFSIDESIGLAALENESPEARLNLLLPPDALVTDLPRLDIDSDASLMLMQGKHVDRPVDCSIQGLARIYTPQGFQGLVRLDDMIVPVRLMANGHAT